MVSSRSCQDLTGNQTMCDSDQGTTMWPNVSTGCSEYDFDARADNCTGAEMTWANFTPVARYLSPAKIYVGSFLALLQLTGVLGNSFVILCFVKEVKLRTTANFLIIHLSVVDLLYCLINLPALILAHFAGTFPATCTVTALFGVALFMLSLHAQCLIAGNRFVLITQSIARYKAWCSRGKIGAALGTIWCFDIVIFMLIPFMLSQGRAVKILNWGHCLFISEVYHYDIPMTIVSSISFIMSFVCYTALLRYVQMNSMTLESSRKKHVKTSMTLFLLMIMFFVTFVIIPSLFIVLDNVSQHQWATGISIILQSSNFVVNPIMYGLRIQEFRKTYQRLLCPCGAHVAPS